MNFAIASYIVNKTGPLHLTFDDEAMCDSWFVMIRDIENAHVMDDSGRIMPAGHIQTSASGPSHTE